MNPFVELRKQALEKRNTAIALAKSDYEQRLIQIAKLERELTGNYRRYRKVTSCVEQVIPVDREFSTQDIMVALEALDNTRTWRKDGVDKHLSKMRQLGLIQRVRKPRNNEPAIYVRAGVATKDRPFQDMTLVDVMAHVLKDGSSPY